MNITERVLRRLLRERVTGRFLLETAFGKVAGLGALVVGDKSRRSAYLYDTNALIDYLRYGDEFIDRPYDMADLVDRSQTRKETVDRILKGYITTAEVPEGCYGASIVAFAAGPGYGKELYAVAYALSPTGLLTSDRTSVSPKAQKAWKSVEDKGRKRHWFDNIRLPKEQRRTPDDPHDDCVMHPPSKDFLNYAYEAEGWEKGLLQYLTAQHEETMKDLAGFPDVRNQVEKLMVSVASDDFWRKHYRF